MEDNWFFKLKTFNFKIYSRNLQQSLKDARKNYFSLNWRLRCLGVKFWQNYLCSRRNQVNAFILWTCRFVHFQLIFWVDFNRGALFEFSLFLIGLFWRASTGRWGTRRRPPLHRLKKTFKMYKLLLKLILFLLSLEEVS